MTMHSRLFNRVARVALVAVFLAAAAAQAAAAARPEPGARRTRRGFNLFAEVFTIFLVNRVACGVNNLGEVCVDPGNSPIGGGGFWPRGTPDQYIFNSGLQIAGIIPADAGFEWAGDTVGAFFMDPKGTEQHGDGVTPVYNSLDPADAAGWPNGAVVRDTAIYASILLGRNAVSQQDLWVRSWDGNPNLVAGRGHPMGVLVEMRGMGWNFPTGNEDILYFVYNFYNITASDPAVYAGLDAAIQGEIAAVGVQFQDGVQRTLGVNVPDGGYRVDNVFAAFFMDPDVEDASFNFSTAVLPFSLAIAYKHDWTAALWGNPDAAFPASIFGPPFAKAPGFVGVKYLRSPINPATQEQFGLTMFSNTLNSATGFPDPDGIVQGWRYLSGNINTSAGDNPCTVPSPIQRRLCFLAQNPADTRFYQSSGPFSLEPGQVQTIVVAYVHGAPVASAITVGTVTAPGIPPSASGLAAGTETPRAIDRATGWVSHSDTSGDGEIQQNEVETVPRSLLQKSLVAQAVFDNKFLLPFAPEPPSFFLVPGEDAVTIVWEPSPTETAGDPFFAIANDPTSALFDPNFREFDVEGYRVYRGRTAGALELIAQFDYETTTYVDRTGAVNYGNCAPELGIDTDCPVTFDFPATLTGPSNAIDITGNLVQVTAGGRVLLADSATVITIAADTAVTGGGSNRPALSNTGVPFAFVDRGVRNSLTYFYAVTALDVNSAASGPSSLESAPIARAIVPRGPSSGFTGGEIVSIEMLGADGTPLDLEAPVPTLDPATGMFSGPMPPTDGIDLGLAAFVSEVVNAGQISLTIDSIVPGYAAGLGNGATETPVTYYMTGQGSGDPLPLVMTIQQDAFSDLAEGAVNFRATSVDSARAATYGGAQSAFLAGKVSARLPGDYRLQTFGRASANEDPEDAEQTGPRWWAGAANENVPEPNSGVCDSWDAGCGGASVPVPNVTLTAGRLPGVDTIFHPSGYITAPSRPGRDVDAILAGVTRAADFAVYWGAGGAVDSVMDLTHRVPVPFSTKVRASWGILNSSGFAGTSQATTDDQRNDVLTWADMLCVDPVAARMDPAGTLDCGGAAQVPAVFSQTAELSLVAPRSSANDALPALATSVGSTRGFIFYLNGHFFVMSMASLPSAGTVWFARFFSGNITGSAAGDDYAFEGDVRPGAVPGLRIVISYTGASLNDSATTVADLERVHTVPDPYYVTNSMEITTNRKVLKFVNLPAKAIIRIYSLSGVLIRVIEHNDPAGGGEAVWDLRNRNNQFIASGVYFYHLETVDGRERIGRFTVVNFAQ